MNLDLRAGHSEPRKIMTPDVVERLAVVPLTGVAAVIAALAAFAAIREARVMSPCSPIARRLAPPRVAPAADGSASCGRGASFRTKVCAASVLAGTFVNSACVGPVQGHDAGRGSATPKSSSICVGVIP